MHSRISRSMSYICYRIMNMMINAAIITSISIECEKTSGNWKESSSSLIWYRNVSVVFSLSFWSCAWIQYSTWVPCGWAGMVAPGGAELCHWAPCRWERQRHREAVSIGNRGIVWALSSPSFSSVRRDAVRSRAPRSTQVVTTNRWICVISQV